MTSHPITDIGPAPRTLGRIPLAASPVDERPAARARLFREKHARVVTGPAATIARKRRARLAGVEKSGNVLSVRQFECFLLRERSLADRGTRRFSLLVLRLAAPRTGMGRRNDTLAELARQACRHLRSTDLVARMGADRLEILLTDTEPAGSRVVAAWVEQVAATLGLELEQEIYVYPTAEDPDADRDPELPRGNGSAGPRVAPPGPAPEARNGKAADPLRGGRAARVQPAAPRRPSRGVPAGGPIRDLWPRLGASNPRWKRSLDVLVSAGALLVLFPLFVLIALAIRLDSPGPVVFRQMRAGRGGRPFVFYKFRSMGVHAEAGRAALAERNEQSGPVFKIQDDPRITRPGRWLRRWSLDELPQLWNVLKGDLSLVGPRSPTFDEVQKYERWQRRRLSVTGGITCFWQVSGRSQIPFRDWMRLDLRYVARRSPWVDLKILALTLPAVLSGRGAC